ncbi:MAG: very short patch repair endonuclease [Candidatus Binatia bacterium]
MTKRKGDVFSKERRSAVMRAVPRAGTSAEVVVRQAVTRLGVRYRLNRRELPGSPDLSNVSAGWVLFVHGCFWHGHPYCKKTKGDHRGRIPRQNARWWEQKIAANRARDARKARAVRSAGLRVLTIWECELKDHARLLGKLRRFLGTYAASR